MSMTFLHAMKRVGCTNARMRWGGVHDLVTCKGECGAVLMLLPNERCLIIYHPLFRCIILMLKIDLIFVEF